MRVMLWMLVAVAAAGAAGAASVAQRTAQDDTRLRPLDGLSCSRNDLTSYTGTVVRYTRALGSTTLRIRTDWDSTEDVTLTHPGTDDPSALFRMQGRPFAAADWIKVERSRGVLAPGVRAAAWVCANGSVIVDWQPPKE